MTLKEMNRKGYSITLRDRNSSHITGIDSLQVDRALELHITGEDVLLYKYGAVGLIIFELGIQRRGQMDLYSTEYHREVLFTRVGEDILDEMYNILVHVLTANDDVKKATIVLSPMGRMVWTSFPHLKVQETMAFPTDDFDQMDLGTVEGLTKLYMQIDKCGTALIFAGSKPYISWPSLDELLVRLLGFPYSLYYHKKPFSVDFWTQVAITSPEVYEKANGDEGYMSVQIHQKLKQSNLALINHEEGELYVGKTAA